MFFSYEPTVISWALGCPSSGNKLLQRLMRSFPMSQRSSQIVDFEIFMDRRKANLPGNSSLF